MAGKLLIQKQSITKMNVDCIVNAANNQLRHGGGVCGAIFEEAGAKELQAACDVFGYCPTGDAVITPGFRLKAKYIVHAVGPIWQGGNQNEEALLYSCYQNAIKVAADNGCRSMAFPLISSGIYGYPIKEAWRVAIKAIQDSPFDMDVIIAVINDKAFELGTSMLSKFGDPQNESVSRFVFFWHEYAENGIFSQWHPTSFVIEGIRYATAEQYMMAKKALLAGDLRSYALIMNEPNPQKCKKLGRLVSNLDTAAWDKCKEEVVINANMAKFGQNPEALQALLHTGNRLLVEASPLDNLWGIGMDASNPDSTNPGKWNGPNLLGKILMYVREKLRDSASE